MHIFFILDIYTTFEGAYSRCYSPDERLQQLVNAATAPAKVDGPCPCNPNTCGCKAVVPKTTQTFIINAEALILQIQRIVYDVPAVVPVLQPGQIQ